MKKVYEVEFMQYTNCLRDTVSDGGEIGKTKYIHVGNEPFLIKEAGIMNMFKNFLKRIGMSKNDYNDYYGDGYETENMKFIWGVKSWDDLTGADACLYTMNDIDIVYDKENNNYMLGIETAYLFKTHADECEYLRDCLKAFTKYMDDNGLSKNEPYRLWMSNPCTSMKAETIEKLYTNFKIFVDGFCFQNIDVN